MKVSQLIPVQRPDWAFSRKGRGSHTNTRVDRDTVDAAYSDAERRRKEEQERKEREERAIAAQRQVQQLRQAEIDQDVARARNLLDRLKTDFPEIAAAQERRIQAEREAMEKKRREANQFVIKYQELKDIEAEIASTEVKLKKLLGGKGIPDEELVDMLRQKIDDLKKKRSSM